MLESLSKFLGIKHIEIDYSDLKFISDPALSREEALKRNAEFVTCPKCGVEGNRPNMMRWHFENCKTKLKNCQQCGKIIPRQGTKDHVYNAKKYCGRKCYMESKKGKNPITMTQEIRNKISNSRKKSVTIKGYKFESVSEASSFFGVCPRTIHKWVNNGCQPLQNK